ncbi:MAG: hypothetical protein WDW36_006378 [Sanguina aurantia]
MAQMWPPPKPKLAQEEFDEAVKTNVDDFDMQSDEAVESAVNEFELQGYDLSTIIRSATGTDFSKHAVATATSAVDSSVDQGDSTAIAAAVAAFAECWKSQSDNLQEAHAVALKAQSLRALLAAVRALSPAADGCGSGDPAGLKATLTATRTLMLSSLEMRDSFVTHEGPEILHSLLTSLGSSSSSSSGSDSGTAGVLGAVVCVAEAASLKQEDAKCRFVEIGFAVALLELLKSESLHADAVSSACGCIRSYTTADDDRPPSSKAFAHARALCKHHAAMKVLLGVLKRVAVGDLPALTAVVLATVRQVAANEDICREFSDGGGVAVVLGIMRSNPTHKELSRSCCGALRQLANSDGVKRLIASSGGIALVLDALALHDTAEDLAEGGLGLLGNICLRLPEVATMVADAGAIDAVLGLLSEHPNWAAAGRQAAILLRNMVVRNPELRPVVLEKGGEEVLRAIKDTHPRDCGDVAAAALRDLGLENYGSTMVTDPSHDACAAPGESP